MKEIEEWEDLTNKIVKQFLFDYFDDNSPAYDFVANDIGGVFNYADYWFNFSDVITCYKLNITFKQFIDWYDFCLNDVQVDISLARYVQSPEDLAKKEQEYLQKLKERVIFAQEVFNKELEKYAHRRREV